MRIKEWDKVTIVRPSREIKIYTLLCVSNKTYNRLIRKDQRTEYLIIGSSEHQMLSSLNMFDTFKLGMFRTVDGIQIAFETTQLIEISSSTPDNVLFKLKWYISTLFKKVFFKRTTKSMK